MKPKVDEFLKQVIADNGKLDIVFNGIGAITMKWVGGHGYNGGCLPPIHGSDRKDLRLAIPDFQE